MRITNESYMIGYQGENYSRDIKYEISDNFKDFRIFIEFEKPNGEKFTTKQLEDIESGIYKVPYELLNECGNLEVQLVGVNEDGIIHKSMPKTFYVSQSINAIDELIESENGWQLVEDIYSRGVALKYDEKTGLVSLLGKDKNGNDIVLSSIDLPSERVIKSIYYDEEKKSLVFEFDNYPSVEVKIELNDFVKKENIATINGEEITNGGNITTKDISVNEIKQLFTSGKGSEGLSTNYEYQLSANVNKGRQRACVYGNGYFVMVGASGQVEYSQDNGATWKSIPKFANGTLTGLAYGNGVFVLVEYETKKIWSVDIPTNEWQNVYTFENNMLEGCRYVNNEFVVVGTYGLIAKSNDGKAWRVVHTYEDNINLYDIAYGNGKYIVVGQGGLTLTSINGNIWYENQLEIITTDIRSVAYANGNFVLGTSGGVICYSSDGINWQQTSNPSELAIAWVRGFAYGDNRLYACMYASNGKGELWYSEDKGKTWSVALTIAQRLWCCCYGGDTFILGGESGIVYYLDLEIEWQETNPNSEVVYYKQVVIQNDGSTTQSDVYKEENSTTQELMKEVTYEELVALRDNSQLVAGQQYRIIDYDCTTVQDLTASAMHPFDIIVVADDKNKLNENARACLSARDNNYFRKKIEETKIIEANFKDGITFEDINPQYFIGVDFNTYEIGEDKVNDGANVGRSDYIVEIGYATNNEGIEVPVFYKNDASFIESGEEGTDYTDTYFYVGQEEFEGVIYDKWRKIEEEMLPWDGSSQLYVLTNIVVNSVLEVSKTTYIDTDLNAWELKYSLDNDVSRFAWACDGLQIYTDDGFWLKNTGIIEINGETYYKWENENLLEGVLISKTLDLKLDDKLSILYDSGEIDVEYSTIMPPVSGLNFCIQKGKGVVYYMKDDKGNECGYDFKNILCNTGDIFYYTFNSNYSGGSKDLSLSDVCRNNKIENPFELTMQINVISLQGTEIYNNYFSQNCYRCHFIGFEFYDNKIYGEIHDNNITARFFKNIINKNSIIYGSQLRDINNCIFDSTISLCNIERVVNCKFVKNQHSSYMFDIENNVFDEVASYWTYPTGYKSQQSKTSSKNIFTKKDYIEGKNDYFLEDYEAIDTNAFEGKYLNIYISSKMKAINENAFNKTSFPRIFFTGNEFDWFNIVLNKNIRFYGDFYAKNYKSSVYQFSKPIVDKLILPNGIETLYQNSLSIFTNDSKNSVFILSRSIKVLEDNVLDSSKCCIYIPQNVLSAKKYAFNGGCILMENWYDPENFNQEWYWNDEAVLYGVKYTTNIKRIETNDYTLVTFDDNCGCKIKKIPADVEIVFPDYISYNGKYYKHTHYISSFVNNVTKKVTLPSFVEFIGNYAFQNAFALNEIIVPTTLKAIGKSAFANSNITKFDFPENLIYIGINAFNSSKLENVVLYDNVEKIGKSAFAFCKNLKSAKLGKKITSIPASLFELSSLSEFNFEDWMTKIEYRAFANTLLTNVNLNNILFVEDDVFYNCELLKKVVAPKLLSVNETFFQNAIEVADFGNLRDLGLSFSSRSIKLIIRTPSVCVLNYNNSLIEAEYIVYVPDDLVEQYKVATNWVNIAERIKPLSEYVEEE